MFFCNLIYKVFRRGTTAVAVNERRGLRTSGAEPLLENRNTRARIERGAPGGRDLQHRNAIIRQHTTDTRLVPDPQRMSPANLSDVSWTEYRPREHLRPDWPSGSWPGLLGFVNCVGSAPDNHATRSFAIDPGLDLPFTEISMSRPRSSRSRIRRSIENPESFPCLSAEILG